jgi:hypothetical protein
MGSRRLLRNDRGRVALATGARFARFAAFQKKFPDGRWRVDGIVELVRDAEACGINLGNQPYSFIEELCSEDFVQAYLPYAMNDPHPLLAQMIMVPVHLAALGP